ncbi:hypothetical protein F5X71_08435 [Nocardia brasiliensis]|uniref:SprT-like family n=1 Tax=Nocardia brasiliensis TaxID=37326 RepID=A0A6G9XN50_NOCBR|nr:hypothetical protein [Nocardia brasiliensis]QIS02347.1 hypothetical protein F5X71_08435 [Nocardia brasiliensis]
MSVVSAAMVAAIDEAWAGVRSRHPEVPDVMITIAAGSVGRRGVRLGQFGPDRWVHGDARLPELFVGGEGFVDGPREVLATLLHEAAHGVALTRGVKDTSRGGAYHNGKYREIAVELGLSVDRSKGSGWSDTAITDRAVDSYRTQIDKLGSLLVAHRRSEHDYLDELVSATDDDSGEGETESEASNPSPHNGYALRCSCDPVRRIRASRKAFDVGPIVCGVCADPFTVTTEDDDS